jgi:elongation factor P hydroxylase
MPWLSEAMKDVVSCDKLRGGANNHYIRRFPNGATHYIEDGIPERGANPGTETSKYPEEKKTIVIP